MIEQRLRNLVALATSALRSPTPKQEEAFGRLAHTLCVACCVGFVTVIFGSAYLFWTKVWYASALLVWAVVLFLAGAILSKGA